MIRSLKKFYSTTTLYLFNIGTQGRIIHCAGCTMGGGPPRRKGAPADQLPNFYHAVLTFERLVYA